MIPKKEIRSTLDHSSSPDEDEFLKVHRTVEGYLKRVLLIGLRLNSVQYENARRIIRMSYLDIKSLVDKSVRLLSKNSFGAENLAQRHPKFESVKNLFFEFSGVHRNRISHGIATSYSQDFLLLLCHVDASFVTEYERTLQNEFGHSAFDQPSDWGASRGKSETPQHSINRLNLGDSSKKPLEKAEVRQKLKNSGIGLP